MMITPLEFPPSPRERSLVSESPLKIDRTSSFFMKFPASLLTVVLRPVKELLISLVSSWI